MQTTTTAGEPSEPGSDVPGEAVRAAQAVPTGRGSGDLGDVLRLGRRQAVVTKALLERYAHGSTEVADGVEAARRVARFVSDEGWAVGDAWRSSGPQWLLCRWALEHQVDRASIVTQLAADAEQAASRRDGGGGDGVEAAGGGAGVGDVGTHPDRPADRATEADRRAHARRAARARSRAADLRRGLCHTDAMDALLEHQLGVRPTIDDAIDAALATSQFALVSGWVRGPLWLSYGHQLLLSRWAVHAGVTREVVADGLASRGGGPGPEDGTAGGR